MKNLMNFSNVALTRSEMKNVKGGLCAICSQRKDGPGGGCGTYSFGQYEANSMANEFNGYNDGYSYFAHCL